MVAVRFRGRSPDEVREIQDSRRAPLGGCSVKNSFSFFHEQRLVCYCVCRLLNCHGCDLSFGACAWRRVSPYRVVDMPLVAVVVAACTPKASIPLTLPFVDPSTESFHSRWFGLTNLHDRLAQFRSCYVASFVGVAAFGQAKHQGYYGVGYKRLG